MVREQTRWMTDILEDPARTGLVIVTTPEEMPVSETIDLIGRLDAETGVDPSAIVANRVLPALFDRRQAEVVDRLGAAEPLLVEVAGPGVRQVLAAAHVTEARRRVDSRHLERLRDGIPAGLPVLYVPELFTKATGRRVVALMAQALAEELDVS
jgi:anion-transporting  ArsA/GET3 family ATPase